MNIKSTYQAMQAVAGVVLPTFTFYGMYKSQYNSVREIEDYTLIVEPPRQWPLNPRDTCQAKFTAKVWIGIRQSIKPATDGTFEYPPFNEIDIRDTLVTAANTFVTGLNSHTALQVINDLDADSLIATIFDAPEGQSTNWQSWLNFSVDIISYGTTGVYLPTVYAPGISNITQLTILNGATLPTGIRPDVLFIDTGVINTDISVSPYVVTVPAGFMLNSVTYYISTDDVVSSMKIYNTENGVAFFNDTDFDQEIVNAARLMAVTLPSLSYNVTADNVGLTSTLRVILQFQNVLK